MAKLSQTSIRTGPCNFPNAKVRWGVGVGEGPFKYIQENPMSSRRIWFYVFRASKRLTRAEP
jgi:hypothetical protein